MNIKKLKTGPKSIYPDHLISLVCQDLLSGNVSYSEARRKYNISPSTMRGWISNYEKQYGSNLESMEQNINTDNSKAGLELKELEAKNKQLQAALELARLENLVLNTMIDIADKELNTNIRKKSGAKQ